MSAPTSPTSARLLTFNLKLLARHAATAWGVKINVPWLCEVTGLNDRPVRGWWDATTNRMELSTIGIWCNLFWCHPHELIAWPGQPVGAGAVRRPRTSLDTLLAAGVVMPLGIENRLPTQLASLQSDARSSVLRQASLSRFAALERDATAVTRHVLSQICRATSAEVGDFLIAIFPPEAGITPHQPRSLSDILPTQPRLSHLPEDLQDAFTHLDPSQRTVVDLRYGLTQGQRHSLRAIAQQVGSTAETVRVELQRIRRRLQELAPESGANLDSFLPESPPTSSATRARVP